MGSFIITIALSVFIPNQIDQSRLSQSLLLDEDIKPHCIYLSLNGKRIAVAGDCVSGGDWKIFDLTNGKCLVDGLLGNCRCTGAWAIAISDNNTLMAVGGNRGSFYLIDAKTGKLYWDLTREGHLGVINNLYFTPDNKYLISTSFDMMMRVWDIKNKKPLGVFRFSSAYPGLTNWNPDAAEKAKWIQEIKGSYGVIGRCALAPNGRIMAIAGCIHSEIPFVDVMTGKIDKTIKLKQAVPTSLQFSTDGKWLIAGGSGQNARIEIWDIENGKLVNSIGKHTSSILHVAISPDKKTVISGGRSDGFRVWDVPSGKQKFSFFTKEDPRLPRVKVNIEDASRYVEHETSSSGVAFLPDGKSFLIVPRWTFWNTEIYFYNTASGNPSDIRKAVRCHP